MRDEGWGSGGSPFPTSGSGNDYPSPALHPKDDAATAQVVCLLILFLTGISAVLLVPISNFKLMMTGASKRRAAAALFAEGNI